MYGAHAMPVCRFRPSEIDFELPGYRDNKRFVLLSKSHDVNIVDNLPHFPPLTASVEVVDPFYRTCYGPTFVHNGLIFARTNRCLTYAATRLLGARKDCNGNTHEDLCAAQKEFITRHKKILTDYGHILCQHIEEKYDNLVDSVVRLVREPHPKRKLRIAAFRELLETNNISSEVWFREVLGNVKGEEWAKPMKYPRLVNDLTTAASLLGASATHIMKDCMAAKPLWHNGGVAIFVSSPNHAVLTSVFDLLINASHPVFIYFSDDACFATTINGKRLMCNLDISTCDGSHTNSLFQTLTMVTRGKLRQLMRRLIQQCKQPLKLKTRKGRHTAKYRPREPVLYSGSTLTTLVNNMANLCIFISVMETRIGDVGDIVSAAARAGYNVTCDVCHCPEKLQFLKHSPCSFNGHYRPVLNAGVILRLSGVCKRDLPGRKKESMMLRANRFQRSLMNCFKNSPRHPLIDALTPTDSTEVIHDFKSGHYILDHTVSDIVFDVPIEHFSRRYDITVHDYEELCNYSRFGFGYFIRCRASHAMLKLDYGLDAVRTTI